MRSDAEIITQFYGDKGHLKQSNRGLEEWRERAKECHAFYAGDTMHYKAFVGDARGRSLVTFNRVKPFVNAVAGFMIQMRREADYSAIHDNEAAQAKFSEYANAFKRYLRGRANADQKETSQDMEMLITGIGAVDTGISYLEDPRGDMAMEKVPFDEFGFDPYSREKNLMDARYVWRRRKMHLEDIEALYDVDADDQEVELSGAGDAGKAEFNPMGGVYNKIGSMDTDVGDKDMANVYYYQWWEYDSYYVANNPIYGMEPNTATMLLQQMETLRNNRGNLSDKYLRDDVFAFNPKSDQLTMTSQVYSDMQALFDLYGVKLEAEKYQRKCYYTAILSGRVVFQKFKSFTQRGFTLMFKTADWDEKNKCWFGMVHSLKEPAKYANKALTEIMWMIASTAKGGYLYEEGAVTNPQQFEAKVLKTDSSVEVAAGALAEGRIQPKSQPVNTTGNDAVLNTALNALPDVVGVNPEFMGNSDNRQVSALLESQRIRQVTATLAVYFDAIALYQKEHAEITLDIIRILAENGSGRRVRILGEQGSQEFAYLLEDYLVDGYEVEINEAPDSATQKQENAEMMLRFGERVAMTGGNIWAMVARYLPIAETDKQELIKMLQPPPAQPDPAMEQMKQLAVAEKQIDIERKTADVKYTQAKAGKEFAGMQQTNLENEYLATRPVNEFNLTI